MDHNRSLARTLGIGILQAETARLHKIKLCSCKLMFTTERIGCHKIDLRTIECSLTFLLEIVEFVYNDSIFQLPLC
ncbi:hypothetical protein D3C86_1714070 [compost metagenome]